MIQSCLCNLQHVFTLGPFGQKIHIRFSATSTEPGINGPRLALESMPSIDSNLQSAVIACPSSSPHLGGPIRSRAKASRAGQIGSDAKHTHHHGFGFEHRPYRMSKGWCRWGVRISHMKTPSANDFATEFLESSLNARRSCLADFILDPRAQTWLGTMGA